MPNNININININIFWKRYCIGDVVLYLKGYIHSHSTEEILESAKYLQKEGIENFAKSLDGHFALIIQRVDFCFILVDKIRSTPLFFVEIDDNFYIDCNPKNLIKKKGFVTDVSDDATLEVSMSGYTIGNKTIYKNLNSLKAGELVVFDNNKFKYTQYYKYFGNLEYKKYDDYIEELSEVTLNIFRKMLKKIGNRQIVVPLSAGNDSRLVASILKYLGVENVKCYSYGSVGNFEANFAKVIAKKLGYDWMFIPLTHKSESLFYHSEEFQEYLDFSETFCSMPYIQSLSTIKYLKEAGFIDKDAIFINGNSADFISGGHINILMKGYYNGISEAERKENILNNLIQKHFSLWGYLKTSDNIDNIKKSLWSEINLACEQSEGIKKDHLFYEYSELIDRQSKYVILGQMCYEFYGHEWRLPLWDDEYLFFWQKIPVEFKVNQRLYIDMLKKKNYGGVWGDDIPVNKKSITPRWMIPVRFLIKIPFGIFGKKGASFWRQFEINFLYYWMDDTHMMNIVDYSDIARDFLKKPRNFASWLSKIYLNKIEKG
jgi:asparagine synthase (glutamine-hydrolysing)